MSILKELIAVGAIAATIGTASAQDMLAKLDGIWVSVNPPGPHIYFNRVGLGQREASLPIIGQASLRVSDGTAGSNLRVSGVGFDCFYFVGFITNREMTWQLMRGDTTCPPSAHYKKDPP